jgi:adenylate cyclase
VATTGRGLVVTTPRAGGPGGAADYTVAQATDWGVYAPVEAAGGGGLVGYVWGCCPDRLDRVADLAEHPDLARAREAAQLVAGVYAALARLRRQRREIEGLLRFLPQPVRVLTDRGPLGAALEPRVVPVTVLFCDIRGSCSLAEAGAGDLEGYWWDLLREALGLMAGAVVEHGGVIGSFLGDAVMAFWGWPDDDPDQVGRAVKAATGIWWRFLREKEDETRLARLGFGIGIAHGAAVAGRLGTPEQHVVGVVGPTVNLAARLEGLTKAFGVPVLLDGAAAERLPAAARPRARRVGWVAPYGIGAPAAVYELHTRLTEPVDPAVQKVCQRYESALGLFEAGDWRQARAELDPIRGKDGPGRFLAGLIGDRDAPPDGWPRRPTGECAIRMEAK